MQPAFGIVFDELKPQAKEGALRAADRLKASGAAVLFGDDIVNAHLVLVFGGDGLVMHTARRIAGSTAAILAVNYGKLGFLAEVQPEKIDEALEGCLQGRCFIETRILLQAALYREGTELLRGIAVNDVTLRGLHKSIDFGVFLDGSPTKAQGIRGDGVIVASPTGSTAYSFSAGGPIVTSDMSCLILTFVCPRFPSRSMVLPDTTKISIQLNSAAALAAVSFDGEQITPASAGDVLEVAKAEVSARFATLRKHSFLHRLQTRLNEGQF